MINKYIENNFNFIGITPGNGKHYFNAELDLCAIIYHNKIRIYYNRIKKEGNKPYCFKNKYEK